MTLATGTRLGPYEIVAPLGAGGMGEVYRARDARLNRDVALKVLPDAFANDPERMARFEREAQVLASLNHPNIAQLYGLEERALVMEYVPGEMLKGPLPLDDALPIARQIAEALEYAHDRGIIHRDLKPANIKITPAGKVKVLDFGLAKALDEDTSAGSPQNSPTLSLAATRMGVILGTAAYMSPEQAKGKPVDRRADIWSFGVVLAELLTGQPLYTGETAPETLAAVIHGQPPIPDNAPPYLQHLLRRCLDKDPRTRLQAIGEARIALEAGEPPPQITTKTQRHEEKLRFSLVSWCLCGGIAVLVLALAALALIHFREQPPETPPVSRFVIPAPEKAIFYQEPALSPDGRRVAFGAIGQDGRRLLWVRSFESLDARPLSGSEDAIFPFWSPDSRFLAFSAAGKLKKVEVAGGPPQTLCDVQPFALGGAWNREGVILFGNTTGGLRRVSSAGGVPTALTSVIPGKELYHARPQFLPDGRHFLYLASGAQPENSAIYVASLDSPKDAKRLVSTAHNAAYVPPPRDGPGHLFFLREGTLMAHPFEERRLELAGEAFPVAEQVSSIRSQAFFSVSTNGVLAYRSGAGGNGQLAWFDRAGKQMQTVGPPGDYSDVALSPDETRVAVTRRDPQGSNLDLWLIDLARNTPSRFTFHEAVDRLPVWSPDGAHIAFNSQRDGLESAYHKVASGAGSDELLLKSSGDPVYPIDWSSDGRYLLYTRQNPKTGFDLWVLPLEGDRKPAIYLQTPFNERNARFSPDGKFIAYASDESGRYEVYVQPFPASGAKWMISSGGGAAPRWRRDGKEIFYLSSTSKLMAVEVKTAPKFEAALPQPLFDARIYTALNLVVSPYAPAANGQRFLLNTMLGETTSAPITIVQNWNSGVKR